MEKMGILKNPTPYALTLDNGPNFLVDKATADRKKSNSIAESGK